MSEWTFLYRPDNGKYFAVVDLYAWRESSRNTQGFSSSKTKEMATRPLTKAESDDYGSVWRLYSCSYKQLSHLLEDELRITENPAWVEKLRIAMTQN